jgi:hypothetical protein
MTEQPGWHIDFDTTTARPAPYRGLAFEMFRWVCLAYLKITGWKCFGDWPNYPKAVMLAAPHTSNWDAVNMLAVAFYYRVRLRWMAKQSLVRWPFGPLFSPAARDFALAWARHGSAGVPDAVFDFLVLWHFVAGLRT